MKAIILVLSLLFAIAGANESLAQTAKRNTLYNAFFPLPDPDRLVELLIAKCKAPQGFNEQCVVLGLTHQQNFVETDACLLNARGAESEVKRCVRKYRSALDFFDIKQP